jgi:hypothetical protein
MCFKRLKVLPLPYLLGDISLLPPRILLIGELLLLDLLPENKFAAPLLHRQMELLLQHVLL